MLDRSSIQVLSRAAAILRACKDARTGRSLGEIAAEVGLPRSTVQRIVQTLAAEGLLIANGAARGIRLGPEIHALADASRVDVVEFAHPYLKALASDLGETVDLAVLRRDHMVFVDQITGGQRLRAVSAVGEQFPLHCTANGKAALAMLGDAAIAQICAAGLPEFTPATKTTRRALMADIARVRSTGIAIDAEEHSLGICALGAAFTDNTGAIFAVSVPMPSVRFEAARGEIEAALRSAVTDLTSGLSEL